jgi:phosphoribosyl 1,2-cyclic phosphate phosphodiesterase
MPLEFQFLGTGNAAQVPCYGCDCPACIRARNITDYRRGPCSAKITTGDGRVILLDAGQTDLAERFVPENIRAILLTHYHMDHVQGLFHIRWGKNVNIPVLGPNDPNGCDDLFKHSGILEFLPAPELFQSIRFGDISITPVPLNHSKPCVGYYINDGLHSVAYLTDTIGLPDQTIEFLKLVSLKVIIIDCSYPPRPDPKNHNSLTEALEIIEKVNPKTAYLTHISHDLDAFFLKSKFQLPANVFVAKDNQKIISEAINLVMNQEL